MSEDDVLAARVFEHDRRDFAGEGTLVLPVHILGSQADCASGKGLPNRCEGGVGGATTMSMSVMSLAELTSSEAKAVASAMPLCIFQLPAMNGLRIGQYLDSGKLEPGEKLEGGAASRGDVGDAFGDARFLDGCDGVAAADRCSWLRSRPPPPRA